MMRPPARARKRTAGPRATVEAMRVGPALALAAATIAGAAGCFAPAEGSSCRADSDCPDTTCTRVGECASETYALRIQWTIRGQAANVAGACDGVGELEVGVSDPATGGDHAVRPVPCGAGSFFYDKLPLGYTEVALSAYSPRGGFLTSTHASAVGSDGVVTIDLDP